LGVQAQEETRGRAEAERRSKQTYTCEGGSESEKPIEKRSWEKTAHAAAAYS